MKRPLGVTLIGSWGFAAGVYLCSIAALMLLLPKTIPALRHLPYVSALKTVSPYPTLVIGVIWAAIAWGLFRLRN